MARRNFRRASERAEPARRSPERRAWDAMVAEGRVPKRAHKTSIVDTPEGYGWECACRLFAFPFPTLEAAYAAADAHAKGD